MSRLVFIYPALLAFLFSCKPQEHEKGYIRAGSLQVYYEKTGNGSPIILVHAGYMDHSMWDKQVAFLSKANTVITIDLPRHGLTRGTDSTTLVADVLRTCLDSLHLMKASFAGLSLGGVALADFALAYPDRVDKLIFVCAGINGFTEVIKIDSITSAVFERSAAAFKTGKVTDIAETFAINWCDGPLRKSNAVDPLIRKYVYDKVVATERNHAGEHFPVFKYDPVAATQLSRIKNKTLVILGNMDVPYIISLGHYLHDTIAGSRLEIFEGAAHMVNLEQPGKFNDLVYNFLK
jgi:3-oxoadipate enol-lactonase